MRNPCDPRSVWSEQLKEWPWIETGTAVRKAGPEPETPSVVWLLVSNFIQREIKQEVASCLLDWRKGHREHLQLLWIDTLPSFAFPEGIGPAQQDGVRERQAVEI